MRLGFAVAVMVRPEILIVDEVFAVGDEEFQRKCYDYLFDLRRANAAMIIVSHGLSAITQLCDEAVWLEQGKVRGIGPSEDITRAYLDWVNAKEASRSPQEPDVVESAEPAWRGSGEVRVQVLELLDDRGEAARFLLTGSGGTIRLKYLATQTIQKACVSIRVEDQRGQVLLEASSRDQGLFEFGEGTGSVDFRMDEVLLMAGNYVLKTVTEVEGHIIEAQDEGFELTVRAPRAESGGAFLQRGTWQLAHL